MNVTDTLLFEIGTEELPPKNLQTLSNTLASLIEQGCCKRGLSFNQVKSFASPRRLAVIITELSAQLPPRKIQKRGPALSQAFDTQQQPTAATLGFLQSCNASLEQLTILKTEKGEWLSFETEEPGQSIIGLIPLIIKEALQTLPIARRMRWGHNDTMFVRPIHWIILLFGEECIETSFFDIPTNRSTIGHRFLAPVPLTITNANQYESLLETNGKVIVDFTKRKKIIQQQIKQIAAKEKAHAVIEEALLEEVTALVEWPHALLARFDSSFLSVPKEVLITAMQVHQKSFALVDEEGKLLPLFIVVSNIQTDDPSAIIQGNEKVMRARLKDALFHYQLDRQTPLVDLVPKLEQVLFQAELGTMGDKTRRLIAFCRTIALQHNMHEENVVLAATLCKADLLTHMVGEFPDLQGIVGYYYADSYNQEIALAIREHYLPRSAEDTLPSTQLGCILGLADRLDNLVALFGIGKTPSGDKDPFALRRQAFAVVRILIEKQFNFDLLLLLQTIHQHYHNASWSEELLLQIVHFCFERLRAWYQDQGISSRTFESVLAKQKTHPYDFHRRIHALDHFQSLPEANILLEMNKRVHNILMKNGTQVYILNPSLLKELAEIELANTLQAIQDSSSALLKNHFYQEALCELLALRHPLDRFFCEIMVMSEDLAIRQNRLALLQEAFRLFSTIADLTLL